VLIDALALGEPGGFVRSFVDEGLPMAELLSAVASRGRTPEYMAKLLAVFGAGQPSSGDTVVRQPAPALIAPLSKRELEVLRLISQGLTNQEIGERLFSPWTRSRASIARSSANSRSSGAPKRSHAPAS
jgi:LuxR family maltose regulon positive regulatory protein